MRCHFFLNYALMRHALALVALYAVTSRATMASEVLSLSGSYATSHRADDLFGDLLNPNLPPLFDIFGDQAAIYGASGLQLVNRYTGDLLESAGDIPDAYMNSIDPSAGIYSSFTTFDQDGQSLWLGFTIDGNTDDRIYHVSKVGSTWQWIHAATLTGNHEMEFFDGQAFASANPAAPSWGAQNTIYLLDTTMPGGNPASTHKEIAQIGGYSTGLAFDSLGDLYVGTNDLSTGAVYEFDASDVAGALTGPVLTLAGDATKLSDMPHGIYDVEVDEADHVLATVCQWGGENLLVEWDGEHTGDGYHYTEIAVGSRADPDHPGQNANYFTFMKSDGDFGADGIIYISDGPYGQTPVIVGISPVPEPSTSIMAIVGGLLAALVWYWRWWTL